MKHSVLLDTSFFIRLLNDEDPLHLNAVGYYKYFLENEITLKVSTISVAEYCVLGNLEDLPLINIQILPFNLKDGETTGRFAKIIFLENRTNLEKLKPRPIIPNDSKLFAQADNDNTITHFITSDIRSKKTLEMLKKGINTNFKIISIDIPFSETYGVLDL